MITSLYKNKKPKWPRGRKSRRPKRRNRKSPRRHDQKRRRDRKSRWRPKWPRDLKSLSQKSRGRHEPKSRCPKRRDRKSRLKSLWRRGPRGRSQKSVFVKQRPSTRALRGKVPRSLRISVEAKLSLETTKPCTAARGIRMEFTRGRRKRNEKKNLAHLLFFL